MFLLDTNVISELRQGKPHQSVAVRAWVSTQVAARLFLSTITILELEKGVLNWSPKNGRHEVCYF